VNHPVYYVNDNNIKLPYYAFWQFRLNLHAGLIQFEEMDTRKTQKSNKKNRIKTFHASLPNKLLTTT